MVVHGLSLANRVQPNPPTTYGVHKPARMIRMDVGISRSLLALRPGAGQSVMSPTKPANDLIGLRDDEGYLVHLAMTDYFSFWPWGADAQTRREDFDEALFAGLEGEIAVWTKGRLPSLFLRGARQAAEEGHFSAKLAPHYERATLRAEQADEVPDGDLPALAAWGLQEALHLRPLEVRECPLCKVPWLADADQPSSYCTRPYPGKQMTCRALKKDEDFRENRGDWRREYKRVYERVKRGTLSEEVWERWRADNSPDAWHPLETWLKKNEALFLPVEERDNAPAALDTPRGRTGEG